MNITKEQETEQQALAKQAKAQAKQAAKAKAEAAKAAKDEADKLIQAEKMQSDLMDKPAGETPVVEFIKIGKRKFDAATVNAAIAEALTNAGRWRKLAEANSLMTKVDEADTEQAAIFHPEVIRRLMRAGMINRDHGNRLLALSTLVKAYTLLATPIADKQ